MSEMCVCVRVWRWRVDGAGRGALLCWEVFLVLPLSGFSLLQSPSSQPCIGGGQACVDASQPLPLTSLNRPNIHTFRNLLMHRSVQSVFEQASWSGVQVCAGGHVLQQAAGWVCGRLSSCSCIHVFFCAW